MTQWRKLAPILFINFISALSFSIVLPFLIVLVLDFGGNTIIYGLLGASFSLFQLIGSPILGNWSDRIGRRKVLIVSHLGTLFSWGGMLVALNIDKIELASFDGKLLGKIMITVPLLLLFLSRVFDGLTGGNISVANAYLVDISTPEERGKNFGYMGVASNTGFIAGPIISAFSAETSLKLQLPILIAIGIGLVGLVLISITIDDKPPVDKMESSGDKTAHQKLTFKETLNLPHIRLLLLINFMIFLGFNFFYVSFPPYLLGEQGWSFKELGLLFSFFGVAMAISQGPVLGFVSKRAKSTKLMIFGSAIMAPGFALLAIGTRLAVFSAVGLISLGNGLAYPSLLALIASHGKGDNQGQIQGLASSSGSAASIVGLVIGGFIFTALKGYIFYISALIFLFLVFMSFSLQIAEDEHEGSGHHHNMSHRFMGSHTLHHLIRPISSKSDDHD